MNRPRALNRGRVLLAVVIGGLTFGIASAVQASIPDATGVIHGCYNTSLAHGTPTGALRMIDTANPNGSCASWEAPLSWNQRGATGARGATGLDGAAGPTGPRGATGPTGASAGYSAPVYPWSPVVLSNSGTIVKSLTLPAGNYVINVSASFVTFAGGGFVDCVLVENGNSAFGAEIQQSAPTGPMSAFTVPFTWADTFAITTTVSFECRGPTGAIETQPTFMTAAEVVSLN